MRTRAKIMQEVNEYLLSDFRIDEQKVESFIESVINEFEEKCVEICDTLDRVKSLDTMSYASDAYEIAKDACNDLH